VAEDADGVHASGVAAPAAAQIDTARKARSEVGRGYGAEQVSEGCGEDDADERHGNCRMMRPRTLAGVTGLGILLWALVVRGSLSLDLGVGRRYRPLGPLTFRIAAPRDVVFDVVSAPYLRKTPRALRSKLEVLERGEDIVLAAHYTRTYGLTATTVETVRFEAPERVHFRLVRGPVPHVVERFELRETDGGTELEYTGELGTDLWWLGALWGAAVAREWEATVDSSLAGVKAESERRAGSASRRA
jgi:Polyketide cyclase / dehydrase and lipid transport